MPDAGLIIKALEGAPVLQITFAVLFAVAYLVALVRGKRDQAGSPPKPPTAEEARDARAEARADAHMRDQSVQLEEINDRQKRIQRDVGGILDAIHRIERLLEGIVRSVMAGKAFRFPDDKLN